MIYKLNKRPKYQYFILYGLPLLIFQLFQYREIPAIILKMSGFIAPVLLFIITFKFLCNRKYKHNEIPNIIKWILIDVLIVYFMAYFFWEQPFLNSYRSSIWCLNLIYFFLLLKYKFTEKELIYFIIIFSIINILLWIYALTQAPQVIFGRIGDSDDIAHYSNNRGLFRISILGRNLVTLLFFFFFVKMFKGRKIIHFFISFILLIYICSDLTRFNIASVLLTLICYVVFIAKKEVKSILFTISVLFLSIILIYSIWGEQIEILLNLTANQFKGKLSSNNDGMWRAREYIYFITEFNTNPFTYILGNGFANSSSLQILLDRIKVLKMYFLSDVSYMQIFISMGLIGLFLYLKLIIKAISLKTDASLIYVKLYLLYALVSNLTIDTILDTLTLSICLYLIYRSNINYKQNNHHNKKTLPNEIHNCDTCF